jgi:galactokinase
VASGRSNDACDLVVNVLKQRRELGGGVLGARLTGRGGGGTVVLVGEPTKVWYEALRAKKALNEATGHSGHVFRWSSPGAMSFGSIVLQPKNE